MEMYAGYAQFIPLRLGQAERDLLMILEGALDISEYDNYCYVCIVLTFRYTNHVDNRMSLYRRQELRDRHLTEFLNCVIGLTVAQDHPMKVSYSIH
jgi:hypothetical protein